MNEVVEREKNAALYAVRDAWSRSGILEGPGRHLRVVQEGESGKTGPRPCYSQPAKLSYIAVSATRSSTKAENSHIEVFV